MKTTSLILSLVLVSAVLIWNSGCAQKPYAPSANEEIYGTWTNPNYPQQKLMMSADGTWKSFSYPSDTVPFSSGTFQLVKKWKDADSSTWYHENIRVLKGVYTFNAQQLVKIDKSGKVWEAIYVEVGQFDSKSYPRQIDPKSESYSTYNRSE